MLVFPRWVVAGLRVRAFPIISSGSLLFHTSAGFALELRRRFLRFALELRRRFLRSACATFRCAVNCDELPEYCAERLSAIMICAKRLRAILIIITSYIIKLYYTFSYFGVTALHRHTFIQRFMTWLLPLLLDVYWLSWSTTYRHT